MFGNDNTVVSPLNNAQLINIQKLVMAQSGTYEDMYLRPWVSTVTSTTNDIINQSTYGYTNLNENTLNNVAASIFRPSATVEHKSFIDNGWDTRRFKFHLTVEIKMMQTTLVQVISGFTDHADISMGGHIDPNTKFYITNIMEISRQPNRSIIRSNDQILHNSGKTDNMFERNDLTYTMLPVDVFNAKHSSCATNKLSSLNEMDRTSYQHTDDLFKLGKNEEIQPNGIGVVDMRTTFSPASPTKLNKRNNNKPGYYLSKILGAYVDSSGDDNTVMEEDVYESAIGAVDDGNYMERDTLKVLNSETTFGAEGWFTYRELINLDNQVDDKTYVGTRNNNSVIPNERNMGTSRWDTSEPETIVAQIISNQLSSIAMDHMVASVWITGTNDTPTGENFISFNPVNETAMGSADLIFIEPQISTNPSMVNKLREKLRRTLLSQLMPLASNNNMNIVTFSARFDFYGDTYIRIVLNNDQEMEYIYPSFCDSLISPLITKDQSKLEGIVHDVSAMFENVGLGIEGSMVDENPFGMSTSTRNVQGMSLGGKIPNVF